MTASSGKKYESPIGLRGDALLVAAGFLVGLGVNVGIAMGRLPATLNLCNWAIVVLSAVLIIALVIRKSMKRPTGRFHHGAFMFCAGWFLCAVVLSSFIRRS